MEHHMHVELGNATPKSPTAAWDGRPTTTYITIPDSYTQPDHANDGEWHPEIDAALAAVPDGDGKRAVRRLLIDGHFAHASGVKGLPNHEAFTSVVHPGGTWVNHSSGSPTWVWSDNDNLAALLADYWGCPIGHPDDYVSTHWRKVRGLSVAPGDAVALKTTGGYDVESFIFGGGPNQTGGSWATGNATATSATTLTAAGTFPTATVDGQAGLAGQVVYVGPNASGTGAVVFGNIVSNSGTVLTVDQWYSVNGLGVGTTPNATASYQIAPGGSIYPYIALDSSTHTPAASDTALTTEVFTSGGGLNRKICPFGHTAAASTFTLTPVLTANGSDTLPVTVKNIGVFNSVVHSTGILLFYTTLNATATLSASGDQLTVTETITM